MPVRTQLFTATHTQAVDRADALAAGRRPAPAPSVDLPPVQPFDLELLGEVAARAVQFGSGDLEVAEVDLDHEQLFRLPAYLCEVLAELGRAEDPELPAEVASAWAANEDLDVPDLDPLPVVTAVVGLVTEAETLGLGVYLWTTGS